MYSHSSKLVKYFVPSWCNSLKKIPEYKVQLGVLNTPIHRWRCPRFPPDVELFIKRDDMTGSTMSGNKVRKLEFIMAEALSRDCRHVITCGGLQSNFCRAVAVAARQLEMTPHLLLRSEENDPSKIGCSGNLLLDRLLGCRIHLMPRLAREEEHIIPKMTEVAASIEEDGGEKCQVIRVGGSDILGLHGYLSAFQELLDQKVAENFDDVVVAIGSGGTAAGLAIGNYLAKTDLKIHAVCVSDNAEYFHKHIQSTLEQVGLEDVSSLDLIDIIDGYKGGGYGISSQEEIEFLVEISQASGVILDPVYTMKAIMGLQAEYQKRPHRFKGKRILFVHTGGIFGTMDGRLDVTLTRDLASTNQIIGYER